MLNVVMLNIYMLSVVMLNVIMLSVVMLSVVMLSVVMLSVVMLNVVVPIFKATELKLKQKILFDQANMELLDTAERLNIKPLKSL